MNAPFTTEVSATQTTALREFVANAVARLPDPLVRGVGVVTNPPDALERVRAEMEACECPVQKRSLGRVLDRLNTEYNNG